MTESFAPDTPTDPPVDRFAKARAAKAAKAAKAAALKGPVAPLGATESVPASPEGEAPGTIVGQGYAQDKVAWTAKYYQDNYEIIWFVPSETRTIRVNGVGFRIIKGRKCGLPEPHYAAYTDSLKADQDLQDEWSPPEVRPTQPGAWFARPANESARGMVGWRLGEGPLKREE